MAHAKAYQHHPTATYAPAFTMRGATEAALRYLAPRLTRGSLNEMDALSRFQPISVLLSEMDKKVVIADITSPDKPIAVLDVTVSPNGTDTYLWAARTEKGVQLDWALTSYVSAVLNGFQVAHPTLVSPVDARNIEHIAWLKCVGFEHSEYLPQYGRKELPFVILKRTKTNV